MRILELYCGIGGVAALADEDPHIEVVGAIDISPLAADVYRHNFSHPLHLGLLESLSTDRLAAFDADLWWASPPCQPFTRRGRQRDLDDPRAATFLALLDRLEVVSPRYFALENVAGFEGSDGHQRLCQTLDRAGYHSIRERLLCPSQLGWPNRRPRFFLIASRDQSLPEISAVPAPHRTSLAELIDTETLEPHLRVDPALVGRYQHALDIVDATDPGAITACFTSAYGRSPVRSGSYLRLADDGLRRFSPAEVLRLLGFPDAFTLPPGLSARQRWRLAGNSLSLPAVRELFTSLVLS